MSLPFDLQSLRVAIPLAVSLASALVFALVFLFTVVPAIRELRRRRRADAWSERRTARLEHSLGGSSRPIAGRHAP